MNPAEVGTSANTEGTTVGRRRRRQRRKPMPRRGLLRLRPPLPILILIMGKPRHRGRRRRRRRKTDQAGSKIEERFSSLLLHRVYPRYLIDRAYIGGNASRYIPHANRALRTFNMYLIVQTQSTNTLRSIFPFSFLGSTTTSTTPQGTGKADSYGRDPTGLLLPAKPKRRTHLLQPHGEEFPRAIRILVEKVSRSGELPLEPNSPPNCGGFDSLDSPAVIFDSFRRGS